MKHPLARDLDHVLEHTRNIWRELDGTRIFITGGTGFVGTWLLDSLGWANERLGVDVQALVLSRDPEAFQKRVPEVAAYPAISYWNGAAPTFTIPPGEFASVIHASTEKQFQPDSQFPSGMFAAEVAGTQHVLEFARSSGTKRFLFTSSGAVYGKQPVEMSHIAEGYTGAPSTTDPGSAYGEAKRVSEWLSFMHGRQFGFAVLIARLFAFVGPRLPLDRNFAVGNFIQDAIRGGPVRIQGDGTPWRSYLYAADLAIWLWTILLKGEAGAVYNVGSAEAISIAELARTVVEVTRPETFVERAVTPAPAAPATKYVPSTDRAQTQLHLRQWIPLGEGIRRTYEWSESFVH